MPRYEGGRDTHQHENRDEQGRRKHQCPAMKGVETFTGDGVPTLHFHVSTNAPL